MKREADRENNIEVRYWIFISYPGKHCSNVIIKEIIIFKNCQYSYVCYEADVEILLSPFTLSIFNKNTCEIVDYNSDKKNQNVRGNKKHVKNTTCNQQKSPPVFMGQCKIQCCNYNKVNEKFERVEQHSVDTSGDCKLLNNLQLSGKLLLVTGSQIY